MLSEFLNPELVEQSLRELDTVDLDWSFFPKITLSEINITETKRQKKHTSLRFSVQPNKINSNVNDMVGIMFANIGNDKLDVILSEKKQVAWTWSSDGISKKENNTKIETPLFVKTDTSNQKYNYFLHFILNADTEKKIMVHWLQYVSNGKTQSELYRNTRINLTSTSVTNYATPSVFWEKKDVGNERYHKWFQKRMLPASKKYEMLTLFLKSSLETLSDEFYTTSVSKLSKKHLMGYNLVGEKSFVRVLRLGKALDTLVSVGDSLIGETRSKRLMINLIDSYNERNVSKKIYTQQSENGNAYHYHQPSDYELFFGNIGDEKDLKLNLSYAYLGDGSDFNSQYSTRLLACSTSFSNTTEALNLIIAKGALIDQPLERLKDNMIALFKSYDISTIYDEWEKSKKTNNVVLTEGTQAFQKDIFALVRETIDSILKIWCSFDLSKPLGANGGKKIINWVRISAWYAGMLFIKDIIADPGAFSVDNILSMDSKPNLLKSGSVNEAVKGPSTILNKYFSALKGYWHRILHCLALDSSRVDLECVGVLFEVMYEGAKNDANALNSLKKLMVHLDGVNSVDGSDGNSLQSHSLYKTGSLLIKACKPHASTQYEGVEIGKPIKRTFNAVKRVANAKNGWVPYAFNISEDILNAQNTFKDHSHGLKPVDYFVNEPSEYILMNGGAVTRGDMMARHYANAPHELAASGYKLNVYVRPFPLSMSTLTISYNDLRMTMLPILQSGIQMLRKSLVEHMEQKGVRESKREEKVESFYRSKALTAERTLSKALMRLHYYRILLNESLTRDSDWRLEWHKGLEYKGRTSFVSIDTLNLLFYRTYDKGSKEKLTPESDKIHNTGIYTAWLVNIEDLRETDPNYKNLDPRDPMTILLDKMIKSHLNDPSDEGRVKIEAVYQRAIREYNEVIDNEVLFISPDYKCPTMARIATVNVLPRRLESSDKESWDMTQRNLVSREAVVDVRSDYVEGQGIYGLSVKDRNDQEDNEVLTLDGLYSDTHLKETMPLESIKKNTVVDKYVGKEDFITENLVYASSGKVKTLYNRNGRSFWDTPKMVAQPWMTSPYLWNFPIPSETMSESIYTNATTLGNTRLGGLKFKKPLSDINDPVDDLLHLDPLMEWSIRNMIKKMYKVPTVSPAVDLEKKNRNELANDIVQRFTRAHVSGLMFEKNKKQIKKSKEVLFADDLTAVVGGHFHQINSIWAIFRLLDIKKAKGEAILGNSVELLYAPLSRSNYNHYYNGSGENANAMVDQLGLYFDFLRRLISKFFNKTYPWVAQLKYRHIFGNMGSQSVAEGGFVLKYQINVSPELITSSSNRRGGGGGSEETDVARPPLGALDRILEEMATKWVKKLLRHARVEDLEGNIEFPPLMNLLAVLRTYCLNGTKEQTMTNSKDPHDPNYIPEQLTIHLPQTATKEDRRSIKMRFLQQPRLIKYIDVLYYNFMDRITEGGEFKVFSDVHSVNYANFDDMLSDYATSTSAAIYEITKIGSNYRLDATEKNSILKDKLTFSESNAEKHFSKVLVLDRGIYDTVHYKKDLLARVYKKCVRVLDDVKKVGRTLLTNPEIFEEFREDVLSQGVDEIQAVIIKCKAWRMFKDRREQEQFDRMHKRTMAEAASRVNLGQKPWSKDAVDFIIKATLDTMSTEAYTQDLLHYTQMLYNQRLKTYMEKSRHDPYAYQFTHKVTNPQPSYLSQKNGAQVPRYQVPRSSSANDVFFELLQVALDPHFALNVSHRQVKYAPACSCITYVSKKASFNWSGTVKWQPVILEAIGPTKSNPNAPVSNQSTHFESAFGTWLNQHHVISNMYAYDDVSKKWVPRKVYTDVEPTPFDVFFPDFACMESELEVRLLQLIQVREAFEASGGDITKIKANLMANDPIYKIILFQYYYLLRDYYKILFTLKQKHLASPANFGPEYEKIRDLYVAKWSLALQRINAYKR